MSHGLFIMQAGSQSVSMLRIKWAWQKLSLTSESTFNVNCL